MIPTRALIYMFLLLFLSVPCFALELELREQAQVDNDIITLSDLAELPAPAADLADLRLFSSPKPGQQQTYSVTKVKQALARHTTDLGEISWTGAVSITVKRTGLMIDQTVLENIIAEFLDSKREFLPQARIAFQAQRYPQPFFLPRGTLTTEVIPSDPQILHSRRFSIIFRVDGQTEENLSINGKLEAIAPVVVVTTDLERGSLLSSQDLNLVEMDIVSLRNPCFDTGELIGKKLKRSLRQGTPLDRRNVEFPPMVSRGELVTLTLRHGPLTLSARGEARQSGKEGDTIRVRNTASQRDILGRIVAPGIIEVEY